MLSDFEGRLGRRQRQESSVPLLHCALSELRRYEGGEGFVPAEHEQAGGLHVQPVREKELVETQLSLEALDDVLGEVVEGGAAGHEGRLVEDEEVFVAVDHSLRPVDLGAGGVLLRRGMDADVLPRLNYAVAQQALGFALSAAHEVDGSEANERSRLCRGHAQLAAQSGGDERGVRSNYVAHPSLSELRGEGERSGAASLLATEKGQQQQQTHRHRSQRLQRRPPEHPLTRTSALTIQLSIDSDFLHS